MVEYRIVTYGLKFQVQSRFAFSAVNGSEERWRTVNDYGIIPTFNTEAEAEEFIDGWLKELEYRNDWEEEVEKFAKDHPPRIYP